MSGTPRTGTDEPRAPGEVLPVKIWVDPRSGGSVPEYQHQGDSGADIRSAVDVAIDPGQTAVLDTGIHLSIPEGFECQIRPRSGLAAKHAVTVLNSPAVIDSSYKGMLKVILINHGPNNFEVKTGDRIAQLVVVPVVKAMYTKVKSRDELGWSGRGDGGLGSTGK